MVNYLLLAFVLYLTLVLAATSPFIEELPAESIEEISKDVFSTTEESPADNGEKDLYVIRKVVYEIGILTDADNSSELDNKTHEQIDVSFFDPLDNGTFVDLSKIPFPVETNVSGLALTGILPTDFGNLVFPQNGTVAYLNKSTIPLFPEKQVKVTKNISTVDKDQSLNILSGISDVLGLSKLVAPKNEDTKPQNKNLN